MSKQTIVPKGFPMGIKINDDELVEGCTLDAIIELSKVYHDNCYIIGHDISLCDKPHYHIHWFACKETSEGAMKVFRSSVLKKKFPHLSKSFRFYTGQDLPDADPICWYAYAVKEQMIKIEGSLFADQMERLEIERSVQNKNKQLKRVHSQKKAVEDKEKRDYKNRLFADIQKTMPDWQTAGGEFYMKEFKAFRVSLYKFAIAENRFGSLKPALIRQYYLEYKTTRCPVELRWTEEDVDRFLFPN